MHSKLSIVEIKPKSEHRYSIIWLHGLGADGHDFEGIVPELHLNAGLHVHFIFPNAPVQAVTINGGMKMRAWFDILDLIREIKVDISGIYYSAKLVSNLIDEEIAKGIPSENIVLAGFSQGGAIALHVGLRCGHKLAGIVALSTFLPTLEQLASERAEINNSTPLLIAHGIIDSVIPIENGKSTYDGLKSMGYNIKWCDFLMDHAVCSEEIEQISDFINSLFQ